MAGAGSGNRNPVIVLLTLEVGEAEVVSNLLVRCICKGGGNGRTKFIAFLIDREGNVTGRLVRAAR